MPKVDAATKFALETKIFLRWVNQRLAVRSLSVTTLQDFDTGEALVALMEILTETKCTGKIKPGTKNRIQKSANCDAALKFVAQCGIQVKSANVSVEDLLDGANNIIGLLWVIMMNFLKFTEDDDGPALGVKDSLIMWFKNQIFEKENIEIKDVTKSFHDGIIIAATVEKYRPKFIKADELNPEEQTKNLQLAFDAATEYFGLEQYLTPEEMLVLDEKSMIVFLSEFFYGIANQRKIDLAARRIGKVITFTQENDAMRESYTTNAASLKETVASLQAKMSIRDIDNTMAGAKTRLDGFYDYKTKEKGESVDSAYLGLEQTANVLAMRLAQQERPAFQPVEGTGLKDFLQLLKTLEETEGVMKEHLHTELNRQVKLVELNEQHQARFNNMAAWYEIKKTYLSTTKEITSVGAANFQLRQLVSFRTEITNLRSSSVADITKRGDELRQEKYENSQDVTERETKLASMLAELDQLEGERQKVAQDDLEREQFKEKVGAMNDEHTRAHDTTMAWAQENTVYLQKKEEIGSIADAELHLSQLRVYMIERKALEEVRVPPLKKLGEEILASEYKSEYSSWKLQDVDGLKARETAVESAFPALDMLSAEKLKVLQDDLERETFREKLRQNNVAHTDMYDALAVYIAAQKEYLTKKEPCESVAQAVSNLSDLASFHRQMENQNSGPVATLKASGEAIITAKYESPLSSYVFPTPDEVTTRETQVDADWDELYYSAVVKRAVLDDDLAREQFKAKLRSDNEQHKAKHANLSTWIGTKTDYLTLRDEVTSVSQAQENLSMLKSYASEKADMTNGDVVAFNNLGTTILEAQYVSQLEAEDDDDQMEASPLLSINPMMQHRLSINPMAAMTADSRKSVMVTLQQKTKEIAVVKFETPQEILDRKGYVETSWTKLQELYDTKFKLAEDDLAREEFKHNLYLLDETHKSKQAVLLKWAGEKKAYLETKEAVASVDDAQRNLATYETYEEEKVITKDGAITGLIKLGNEISSAKYETELSTFAQSAADIAALLSREKEINRFCTELDDIAVTKKAILDDDLAREMFKDSTRGSNAVHIKDHATLKEWVGEKTAYLNKKEPVDSISDAQVNLAALSAYYTEKEYTTNGSVGTMKQLGNEILTAKYETKLSSWVWETPEEIKEREADIDGDWVELKKLSDVKQAILDDDLAREQFREKLRLDNENHKNANVWLEGFYATSKEYLQKKEPVDSIADASGNLAALDAFVGNKANVTSFNVASMKHLGAETIAAKYQTDLSSFVFQTPDEITAREASIDAKWSELNELVAAKRAVLDDDLAREKKKEELRLSFADAAADLEGFVKDEIGTAGTTNFGFVLKEVQDFKGTLDTMDADVTAVGTKKVACKDIHVEMTALGVTENTYTSATPETLDAKLAELAEGLGARQARYATELARQVANDELCKAFAGLVAPFTASIEDVKASLTSAASSDLEVQASLVNDKLAQDDGAVKEMEALQSKMDEAGITFNSHTLLTGVDVRLMWGSYQSFLAVKKKNIDDEIHHKKMRGLTQAQFDELEAMFKRFDANGNGSLDKKEFKACLYSLGEERGSKEVQKIMDTHGGAEGVIKYPGFLEFMIAELGDTVTKEEMYFMFALINGDISPAQKKKEQMTPEEQEEMEEKMAAFVKVCKEAAMLKVMSEEEVAYLKSTHAVDGGVQYDTWTEAVFAR